MKKFNRCFQLLALLALIGGAWLLPAHVAEAQDTVDGSMIVYIKNNRELWLIQPDGSNDRQIWAIPSGVTGEIDSVVWRPDAQQIAFASSHEATCSEWVSDIYTINPDGSGLRRLTNGPACAELAAYSQGLVTVEIENRLSNFSEYLVYVEGAPTAKVVTVAPGSTVLVSFPLVADLGNGVAQSVVAINGHIRWFDAAVQADVLVQQNVHAGRLVVTGSGFETLGATSISWNPDGSKLAFQFGLGRLWQVGVAVALLGEGGPLLAPQVNSSVLGARPAWSPVSNEVLYQRFNSTPMTINLAEANGDTPGRVIASVRDSQGIGWLADGAGFVVAAPTDTLLSHVDLYVVRLAENTVTQLTQTTPGQAMLYPNVAPDNSQIVYTYVPDLQASPLAPQLRLMNSDGSHDRLLVDGGIRADWSRRTPQNPMPTPTMTPAPTATPAPGETPTPGGPAAATLYLPAVRR